MGQKIKSAKLKAFISYSTHDKQKAARVKEILSGFGIDCFVAHDDIHVSQEWEKRIIDELNKADLFIPLLSNNFRKSDWTSQEIGKISIRKKVLILPVMLEDKIIPYGFIRHIQGIGFNQDREIQLWSLLNGILGKFSNKEVLKSIIEKLKDAWGFRYCEKLMELLLPFFDKLDKKNIDKIVEYSIQNPQIWDAALCKTEYLPKFIKLNKKKISKDKLRQLQNKLK